MIGGAVTQGRLGPWEPKTLDERVDRMESLAQIRQLVMRYAHAIDSRNIDAMAGLFAPNVRVGKKESGREAIGKWYDRALRNPKTSIHFVVNHIIDFDDADHARGVVYCRDELEMVESGEWQVGTIQYWDTYERFDGEWCFVERKFHRWYIVDALTRPGHGAGLNTDDPLFARQLPEAYPTWHEFWAREPK